ncbi:MAG: bifunctional folylpolyglutamate synthase/dihydrofolate synthase, partial [Mycobacteriales bacterium]
TNVIDAGVAVITPIGLDHQAILGDTIAEIAAEKAGIIAMSSLVVCAAQPVDAVEPLLTKVATAKARVAREGVEFGVGARSVALGGQQLELHGLGGVYSDIFLPLHGAHQAQNAAVALAAAEAFFGAGTHKPLDPELVREAFAQVSSPGRLERVRAAPPILVDAAHNPHGLRATLIAVAEAFRFPRLVAVLSVPADKDARGMLELLEPAVTQLVVTQNSSPRAMDADELGALAMEVFDPDRIEVAPQLDDAIEAAVRILESEELGGGILVTGSVVTAADARRLLR